MRNIFFTFRQVARAFMKRRWRNLSNQTLLLENARPKQVNEVKRVFKNNIVRGRTKRVFFFVFKVFLTSTKEVMRLSDC